ncbi:hypothetical protein D3C78_1391230 [compost metagenome]
MNMQQMAMLAQIQATAIALETTASPYIGGHLGPVRCVIIADGALSQVTRQMGEASAVGFEETGNFKSLPDV